MRLSIIDRIIIIKSLLPETGTLEQIKTIVSIKNKLKLLPTELNDLNINYDYKDLITIDNISDFCYVRDESYNLTLSEISLIKMFAQLSNENGRVTESSLDTIEYLVNYIIDDQA